MKHYGNPRLRTIGDNQISLEFHGGFDFMSVILSLQQTYKNLEVTVSNAHHIHLRGAECRNGGGCFY